MNTETLFCIKTGDYSGTRLWLVDKNSVFASTWACEDSNSATPDTYDDEGKSKYETFIQYLDEVASEYYMVYALVYNHIKGNEKLNYDRLRSYCKQKVDEMVANLKLNY